MKFDFRFICSVATVLAFASFAHAQWRYVDLNPSGATSSLNRDGINGIMVGGQNNTFDPTFGDVTGGQAILWQNGANYNLTPSNAQGAIIYATDGTYSGGQVRISNVDKAAVWQGITTSPTYYYQFPKQSSSIVYDVAGQAATGYSYINGYPHPVYWVNATKGGDLLPTGWQSGIGYAIDGATVVGDAYNTAYLEGHACYWANTSRAGFYDMHPSGWDGSAAVNSSAGLAVGFTFQDYPSYFSHVSAFVWNMSNHTYLNINPSGFSESEAWGVYNNVVVGYAWNDPQPAHAYMWNYVTGQYLDLSTLFPAGVYSRSSAKNVWWSGTHIEIYGAAVLASTGQYHAIEWIYDPPS